MTHITDDLSGLVNLAKALGGGHRVRVGLFGNKASRHPTGKLKQGGGHAMGKGTAPETNAELGALHEHGSVTRGIPARSWLRMPVLLHGKEIAAEAQGGFELELIKGNIKAFWTRLGIAAENWIQRGFETGGFGIWKPLSDVTIMKKKSSAILIDTAQLRRAVASKVV